MYTVYLHEYRWTMCSLFWWEMHIFTGGTIRAMQKVNSEDSNYKPLFIFNHYPYKHDKRQIIN